MKVFEISISWKQVYERIPLQETEEAEGRRSKLFGLEMVSWFLPIGDSARS